MKSKTAKKVTAIYSLLFGLLAALGTLDQVNGSSTAWTYVLITIMIAAGILLLIPIFEKTEKTLMITMLVVYSLFVFVGIFVLFIIPPLGILVLLMSGVPFAFSIIYLVRLNKENEYEEKVKQQKTLEKERELARTTANMSVEEKLLKLKEFHAKNLLTDEEYEVRKNKLLEFEL